MNEYQKKCSDGSSKMHLVMLLLFTVTVMLS